MNNRGAVLITALWTLVILSMLALGLAYRVRLEISLTRYQLDAIDLVQMAKAGLLLSRMAASQPSGASSLNQRWSQDPGGFKDREVMGGRLTWTHDADGPDGEPATLYGLSDEESRLSLNAASAEALARLPGISPVAAAAIAEWRAPGSAAKGVYDGAPARGGPFRSVDELLLVRGMTPEDFALASPFLTAYGSGKVNVNTASRRVLRAVGLPETVVSKLLLFRAGGDFRVGTGDDGVFQSVASIIPRLSAADRLSADEIHALTAAQPALAVQSTCFRARLKALRGTLSRTFIAVFRAGSPEPLYWHEGA